MYVSNTIGNSIAAHNTSGTLLYTDYQLEPQTAQSGRRTVVNMLV
jgi:hypothetical protein